MLEEETKQTVKDIKTLDGKQTEYVRRRRRDE
jgi:hypothetical protein